MAITFDIESISFVPALGITFAEFAACLKSGTHVFLYNDMAEAAPETISVLLDVMNPETRIATLPSDLSLELRELTMDFEELKAEIIQLDKLPGLAFKAVIQLDDFSWDTSSGVPVLKLATRNPAIHPAKDHWAYAIYTSQMQLKRLRQEEAMIRNGRYK